MASASCIPFYGMSHFLILLLFFLAQEILSCPADPLYFNCPDDVYNGQLPTSHFTNRPPRLDQSCGGPCELRCHYNHTMIKCTADPPYQVLYINPTELTLAVDCCYGPDFDIWKKDLCETYKAVNESFPGFHLVSLTTLEEDQTFLGCPYRTGDKYWDKNYTICHEKTAIVYGPYDHGRLPAENHPPPNCMQVQKYFPPEDNNNRGTPPNAPDSPGSSSTSDSVKIILSTVLPGIAIIISIVFFVYWRRRKNKSGSTAYPSRIMSLNHTRLDLEEGSIINGMTIFSYAELEEVTNNFDPARELGEGGFGIVYYGKLKDGREVAVKRMYEKNYKQVEQFKNEIKILTNMRHQNLVTLYGSSSRHSRELLLVYEYISNGTVADHLHGNQSKSVLLLWPTRMKIAIETAAALSYLHYNDIIHRDIKTNNILLDRNFCAKVADFGLSRLFPPDMTHVSTAPQGTPGYLDPEYHRCYHLTDKSDVYSFGVVLIELISSLPAIDMDRDRHEVNLSSYAMNKIQCSAIDELVDPNLGHEKNFKVRRMITLVAELAFRCLQHEREVRPSMEEVLEALKRIEGVDYDKLEEEEMGKKTSTAHVTNQNPSPADSDDVEL